MLRKPLPCVISREEKEQNSWHDSQGAAAVFSGAYPTEGAACCDSPKCKRTGLHLFPISVPPPHTGPGGEEGGLTERGNLRRQGSLATSLKSDAESKQTSNRQPQDLCVSAQLSSFLPGTLLVKLPVPGETSRWFSKHFLIPPGSLVSLPSSLLHVLFVSL